MGDWELGGFLMPLRVKEALFQMSLAVPMLVRCSNHDQGIMHGVPVMGSPASNVRSSAVPW